MIEIDQLSFRYGRTRALDNLSLRIDHGESVLLAGANGSGKTTLLRILAGVLNSRGTAVKIEGRRVSHHSRRLTAYIASSTPFYDHLRLGEAVRLHGSMYRGFSYRGIGDYKFPLQKQVGALSKGEKTLFLLSLALSSAPKVLLIDDVIHFLDPHLREIFLHSILHLIAEEQLTVIIAAQSAADIEGIPERIVLLQKGRIALDAASESLKRLLVRAYMEAIPPGLPVVFHREWGEMKEVYIYPYSSDLPLTAKIEYLPLPVIIRAFIGGEYDRR